MELRLKDNWSRRLVDKLIPYSGHLPEIAKRLSFENMAKELQDLFGKSRWATIRNHVNNLERAEREQPNILDMALETQLLHLDKLEGNRVASTALRLISGHLTG